MTTQPPPNDDELIARYREIEASNPFEAAHFRMNNPRLYSLLQAQRGAPLRPVEQRISRWSPNAREKSDARKAYETLRETNPFAAIAFGKENAGAYDTTPPTTEKK